MGKWLVIGAEWVYRVVKANLTWVALVLIGGGIFGFFPATIALACLVKSWIQSDLKVAVWQTMWQEYRRHFKLGLQLTALYGGSLLVIFINLRLAFQIYHLYFMMIAYFLMFLVVIWGISLLYLFPLVANFEGTCFIYAHQSIASSLKNLKLLGVQILGVVLIWLLNLKFAALIIFGTAVLWQLNAGYCCRKVFEKIPIEQTS